MSGAAAGDARGMGRAGRRRILVTGAGAGIGRAVAARLVDAGDEVHAFDLRDPDLPGVTFHRCDLSSEAGVREGLAGLGDASVDGLALVAGLPGTRPGEQVFRVNVLGARAVALGVRDRLALGSGVVFVGSISAHRSPLGDAEIGAILDEPSFDEASQAFVRHALDGNDAYTASKKALVALAERLAEGNLARGIRFNVVSPGPVETGILGDFRTSMGADRIQAAADLVGRHATPEEVAAPIVWLLSPEARWVNGIVLPVDGGYHTAARRLRGGGRSDPG